MFSDEVNVPPRSPEATFSSTGMNFVRSVPICIQVVGSNVHNFPAGALSAVASYPRWGTFLHIIPLWPLLLSLFIPKSVKFWTTSDTKHLHHVEYHRVKFHHGTQLSLGTGQFLWQDGAGHSAGRSHLLS